MATKKKVAKETASTETVNKAKTDAAEIQAPGERETIVIQVDDNTEEARLFGIVERLFDDMAQNPRFNIAQVGGLSISLPEGGALKLSKENVEKITVLHLLFKKLIENEPEDVQKQYRHEFGPKIGLLVKSAGDAPIDVRELIKEIFAKLPPEKRQQKPVPPTDLKVD